ncbi:MAG: hypothetical protein COZ47_10260 [Lysobacterales bacterium CG_4_10_14_3_um_filter_64_11]|nr:MAG: hypothetical protein COZ47_10260 [Xanthomonadales bacterium CG_4_10_14_3_um_filter_64_11]
MGVNPVTHLFLDTEWADAAGEQLVSLALLSEDGTHRFYAEIDPLPTPTTLFVRTVVYPLLQRGDAALAAPQLTRRLRMFLAAVPAPRCVMFDAVNDVVLLRLALAGFGLCDTGLGPVVQIEEVLLARLDIRDAIETYFECHSDARQRRHHAGVDADALRRAFHAVHFGD